MKILFQIIACAYFGTWLACFAIVAACHLKHKIRGYYRA